MFKRITLAAVAVVAGMVLLRWAGLGSYTATAWSNICENFKKQVPIEFEIQRLRHEVAQLAPEVKKNCRKVAEEMVAVDSLRQEIASTRDSLKKQRDGLEAMAKDLDTGAQRIVDDGEEYSRSRISAKLEQDWESFKTCEAGVKSREKELEIRERSLEADRRQLAEARSVQQDLERQIAELESQAKAIKLAKSRSHVQFDNDKVARAKAGIAELKKRLQVEAKAVELEGKYSSDPIVVTQKGKSVAELTKEIRTHFEKAGDEEAKVAAGRK